MATYIYGLVCPETDRIRYIGKAIDPERRFKCHLADAKSNKYRHHTANWIKGLLRRDQEPRLVMFCRVPDGGVWQRITSANTSNSAARLDGRSQTRVTVAMASI